MTTSPDQATCDARDWQRERDIEEDERDAEQEETDAADHLRESQEDQHRPETLTH